MLKNGYGTLIMWGVAAWAFPLVARGHCISRFVGGQLGRSEALARNTGITIPRGRRTSEITEYVLGGVGLAFDLCSYIGSCLTS